MRSTVCIDLGASMGLLWKSQPSSWESLKPRRRFAPVALEKNPERARPWQSRTMSYLFLRSW